MRERKQEAVERAREDAAKDPGTTTPMGAEAVLALQRSAGNAAVARLIGGHRVPKPAKPRPRIGGHRPAKPAAQNPYDPLPVENAYDAMPVENAYDAMPTENACDLYPAPDPYNVPVPAPAPDNAYDLYPAANAYDSYPAANAYELYPAPKPAPAPQSIYIEPTVARPVAPAAVYSEPPAKRAPDTVYSEPPPKRAPATAYSEPPPKPAPSAVYSDTTVAQPDPAAVYKNTAETPPIPARIDPDRVAPSHVPAVASAVYTTPVIVNASPERVDEVIGRPGAVAEVAQSVEPPHELVQIGEQVANRLARPVYAEVLKRQRAYEDEEKDSDFFIKAALTRAADLLVQKKVASMEEALKTKFGWTDSDVQKYYTNHEKAKVDYRKTEPQRAEFEVHGGSTMTQGPQKERFSTTGMFSKFKGADFGIYVMSNAGRIYAGRHRVGVFHHSSFLGGGEAAAAGEMKVDDSGKLKHITNKSGHYLPGRKHLVQMLKELARTSTPLSGVNVTVVEEGSLDGVDYAGDAQQFLQRDGA